LYTAIVVQAAKAASIPLSLMARSRTGSKMEVSSVVLAAEAKQADGASKATPRTPRPPHLNYYFIIIIIIIIIILLLL